MLFILRKIQKTNYYNIKKIFHRNITSKKSFDKKYVSNIVEENKYEKWIEEMSKKEENVSKDKINSSGKKFTILLPPPNITGTLHLGHALTLTIQDVLLRLNKMKGYETLWIPGMDHAGIATQVIVEKKLWNEKKLNRHNISREKFIEEVFKWKGEKEDVIRTQMKKMGALLNWEKEFFTMDPERVNAVNEAFIKLFEKGLIYRDNKLVSWSCALQSAISDIEVDYLDISTRTKVVVPNYDDPIEFGTLTKFAYKIFDVDDEILVSTTRPETILGDTAIAVHPEDPRYTKFHNRKAVHPFRNELIPIITDPFVDQNFGTGVVKITPAHDPTDFDVGKRHNLKILPVISENGNVTIKNFEGKRFEVRNLVLTELDKMGLLKSIEDHPMKIPICSRSKDVIEYIIKPQWFMDCKKMAIEAINDVKNGNLKIEPSNFEKTWFSWLENIHDWCISRQLWWGHRIPAYECQKGDKKIWIAARNQKEALEKAVILFNKNESIYDNNREPQKREKNEQISSSFEDISLKNKSGLIQKRSIFTGKNVQLKSTFFEEPGKKEQLKLFNFEEPGKKEQLKLFNFQEPTLKNKNQSIKTSTNNNEPSKTSFFETPNKNESPNSNKLAGTEITITQDSDVLDTWFSSSILPFSSLGWPQNDDFKKWYPLSLMETGHDILFFWVARMVMMGKTLTGQLPFEKILLHGIICDSNGRKMSKSLGNVIFPENVINGATLNELNQQLKKSFDAGLLSEVEYKKALTGQKKMFPNGIPKCGADSLRFTLISHNIKSHFINFDVQECHTNSLFCNKIWQACKFAQIYSEKVCAPEKFEPDFIDKWILSRLSNMISEINEALPNNDFHLVCSNLKKFLYSEFCDIYIESIKSGLKNESKEAQNHFWTLIFCLEQSLRCLYPIMPFVTEELYHFLPVINGIEKINLLNGPYPKNIPEFKNEAIENEMELLLDLISTIRRLKKLFNITSKDRSNIYLVSDKKIFSDQIELVKILTGSSDIKFVKSDYNFNGCVSDTVGKYGVVKIEVPNSKLENVRKEKIRLEKKIEKLLIKIDKLRGTVLQDGFKLNASIEVQKNKFEQLEAMEKELGQLQELKRSYKF